MSSRFLWRVLPVAGLSTLTLWATGGGAAQAANPSQPSDQTVCQVGTIYNADGDQLTGLACVTTPNGIVGIALTTDQNFGNTSVFAIGTQTSGAAAVTGTQTSLITGPVSVSSSAQVINYGAVQGTVSNSGIFENTASGTLNASVVSLAGIFSNFGQINGDLSVSSGTYTGSGHVNGNLSLAPAVSFQVSPTTPAASVTTVDGVATLAGAHVAANFTAGGTLYSRYTILSAGSVTGTFGSLTSTSLPANITNNLTYDPTHAYLNLHIDLAASGSTSAIAASLNQAFNAALIRNGSIPTIYASLTPAGVSEASGMTGTSGTQAAFNAMSAFGLVLLDGSGGSMSGPGAGPALRYADDGHADRIGSAFAAVDAEQTRPARTVAFIDPHWSIWARAFGSSGTVAGNGSVGSSTTQTQVWGLAVGADRYITPTSILGFGMGGGGANFSLSNGTGSGHADQFQAGATFKQYAGTAYASAELTYGWQDVTTMRTVDIGGANVLQGRYTTSSLEERIEAGNRFATPFAGVTPFAAAQLTSLFLPSYSETVLSGSSAFALHYGAKTLNDPRTELGVKFDRAFPAEAGSVTLKSSIAWAYDYNVANTITATFQSLPGARFTTTGSRPAPNTMLTSSGAEFKWGKGWSVEATLNGAFSSTTTDFEGKGTLRYDW